MVNVARDDDQIKQFRFMFSRAGAYGYDAGPTLVQLQEQIRAYIREREELLAREDPPAGLAEVWGDIAVPCRNPEQTWQRLKGLVSASLGPFRDLLVEIQSQLPG